MSEGMSSKDKCTGVSPLSLTMDACDSKRVDPDENKQKSGIKSIVENTAFESERRLNEIKSSTFNSTQSTSSTSQPAPWSSPISSVFQCRQQTGNGPSRRLEVLPEELLADTPQQRRTPKASSGLVERRLGEMNCAYKNEGNKRHYGRGQREAIGGLRRHRSEIMRLLKQVDTQQKPVVDRRSRTEGRRLELSGVEQGLRKNAINRAREGRNESVNVVKERTSPLKRHGIIKEGLAENNKILEEHRRPREHPSVSRCARVMDTMEHETGKLRYGTNKNLKAMGSSKAPEVRIIKDTSDTITSYEASSSSYRDDNLITDSTKVDQRLAAHYVDNKVEPSVGTETKASLAPLSPSGSEWMRGGSPRGTSAVWPDEEDEGPDENDTQRFGAFVDTITGALSSQASSNEREIEEKVPVRRSLLEDPALRRLITNAVSLAHSSPVNRTVGKERPGHPGGLRSAARAEARRAKWRKNAGEALISACHDTVKLKKSMTLGGDTTSHCSIFSSISDSHRPSTAGTVRPRRISLKPPLETFRS